jgi:SNF2 family DNA or RNA helicase
MIILQALQTLSQQCDGAIKKDRMGFNSFDAGYGKYLAGKTELNPYEARTAWQMLQKYRKQLSKLGIDYDSIPKPSLPEEFTRNPKDPPENAKIFISRYDGICRRCGKSIKEGDTILYARPYVWCENCKPAITNSKPTKRIEKIDDNTISFIFPYEEEIIEKVRKLENRKFDSVSKSWKVRLSIGNIKNIINFAIEEDFHIDEKAYQIISDTAEKIEEKVNGSRASEAEIEIEGLGGELLPFQKAGVKYASESKACFIADEMGLGKTVQALATIHNLKAYPSIIICPASLKYNWEREAKKWLPNKIIQVLNGGKSGTVESDIIILNYDVLDKWMDRLLELKPKSVVADESHYIKSYKAQRTKATKKLMKMAEVRLCLTGTPVLNRPQELLSQLGALGRLDDLGGFWNFAKRYCQAYRDRWGWNMSGAAHLNELNEKLRATCYIRRKKEDVLKELPDKRRSIIEVDIDNRSEYREAESDVIAFLYERAKEDEDFLASLEGLSDEEKKKAKQEKAEDIAYKAKRAQELVKIEALKKLTVDGKMKAIEDWIKSFLDTGEKLVVFAHHHDVVEQLSQRFQAVKIIGGDDAEARQETVDKFQNDPNCRLIICSLQAGGIGITLTSASNVAFIELGWTPAVHDQAEDRCHRIGQKNSVNAWYILGKDTIDQDIYALIERKRTVVNATTEGNRTQQESVLNELKAVLIEKNRK